MGGAPSPALRRGMGGGERGGVLDWCPFFAVLFLVVFECVLVCSLQRLAGCSIGALL